MSRTKEYYMEPFELSEEEVLEYEYVHRMWAEEQAELYEKELQYEAEKAAMEESFSITGTYPF